MMTQEEYMDVLALHRQGVAITDIALAVGRHPQTVSDWIKRGGPPAGRQMDPAERVVDERWARRVVELLEAR